MSPFCCLILIIKKKSFEKTEEWHQAIENRPSGLDARICQRQLWYLIYLSLTVLHCISRPQFPPPAPNARTPYSPLVSSVMLLTATTTTNFFVFFLLVFGKTKSGSSASISLRASSTLELQCNAFDPMSVPKRARKLNWI